MSRAQSTITPLIGVSIHECRSTADLGGDFYRDGVNWDRDVSGLGRGVDSREERKRELERELSGTRTRILKAVVGLPGSGSDSVSAAAEVTGENTNTNTNTAATANSNSNVAANAASDTDPPLSNTAQNKLRRNMIAGFAMYFNGYIELEKVDPFTAFAHGRRQILEAGLGSERAGESGGRRRLSSDTDGTTTATAAAAAAATVATTAPVATDQTEEQPQQLSHDTASHTYLRQLYIRAIRGKKHIHVTRMVVHPTYHAGQEVQRAMLGHITAEADREGIVAWMVADSLDVEELCCESGFMRVGNQAETEDRDVVLRAMLRIPRPAKVSESASTSAAYR